MNTNPTRPLTAVCWELRCLMENELITEEGRLVKNPPKWANYGHEYANAIAQNNCGLEPVDMVLARLINNLAGWRGKDARRIKAELNAHLAAMNRRSA